MIKNILKYTKILICFAIFTLLLLSSSYAYPDLYFYDNYLVGQSPYTIDSEIFSQGDTLDETTWENYFPSVTDSYSNLLTGLVTTFSNKYMSGTTIPSAVPLINIDTLVGRTWRLKPGECFVLYSMSGEYQYVNATAPYPVVYTLGTTRPTNIEGNLDGYALKSDGTPYYDIGFTSGLNMSHFNSNFNKLKTSTSINIHSYMSGSSNESFSPYSWSYVQFVYNRGNTDSIFYLNSGESSAPEIEVPSIPLSDVHWIVTMCHTTNKTSSGFARVSVIPHINGNINIYSFPYANILDDAQEHQFVLQTYYEQVYSMSYSNNYLVIDNSSYQTNKFNKIQLPVSYIDSNMNTDLVPVFLDSSFFTSLLPKAVYIRNGYIDITNYDTLIAKLQEAGIGGGDLSQIIALLEEINSGGDTGESVSALINILDSYHDSIVSQGDTDWNIINNTYDLYKNLLDFSGDTIHWIVVANNALFNYFSGFIILCAFFLILDRIMRG